MFLTGPLCPLNSILSQGSSVPLIKFKIAPRFRFLTSKGSKKRNSDRNVKMWPEHRTNTKDEPSFLTLLTFHTRDFLLATLSREVFSGCCVMDFYHPGLRSINPLTPNNLYIRRAVSPLNSRMTYICVANSVSKFGAILFTPIRLTVVACDALGPFKVRLAFRRQNVPPPPPKPLHKHRYKRRQLVTAHFS